jgi:hypothetical protein
VTEIGLCLHWFGDAAPRQSTFRNEGFMARGQRGLKVRRKASAAAKRRVLRDKSGRIRSGIGTG